MGMQTLYGMGAITVSDDRHTYRAHHGKIEVPEHLVPRVLGAGFSRVAPPADAPESDTMTAEPQAAEQAIGVGEHPQAAVTAELATRAEKGNGKRR